MKKFTVAFGGQLVLMSKFMNFPFKSLNFTIPAI